MVPFEDVYTDTHPLTHTHKPNISLKFRCLLFVSTVLHEQYKQQKCRLGFNFWNLNSNSLPFAALFCFPQFGFHFFPHKLFHSRWALHSHSMESKNAWWKHPHPRDKSGFVKLHSMLASLSNHLSLFPAMLICVSLTSGATLFPSSLSPPSIHCVLHFQFCICFCFCSFSIPFARFRLAQQPVEQRIFPIKRWQLAEPFRLCVLCAWCAQLCSTLSSSYFNGFSLPIFIELTFERLNWIHVGKPACICNYGVFLSSLSCGQNFAYTQKDRIS